MSKKEFYGKVSFTGQASFSLKAKDEEDAEEIVFEEIEGIKLLLKDGSIIEITGVEWDLISEARRGNVSQPYISDFEIEEQK